MRISDWSSDVCSSNLYGYRRAQFGCQCPTVDEAPVHCRSDAPPEHQHFEDERVLCHTERIYEPTRAKWSARAVMDRCPSLAVPEGHTRRGTRAEESRGGKGWVRPCGARCEPHC